MIKYTYYGDADLSASVPYAATDYIMTDAVGFAATKRESWVNGEFQL